MVARLSQPGSGIVQRWKRWLRTRPCPQVPESCLSTAWARRDASLCAVSVVVNMRARTCVARHPGLQTRRALAARSRDPEVWKDADILIDVGGEYDPARHRYDHHQKGFAETFGHGHSIKLSSAGLVYKHFGEKIITRALLPALRPALLPRGGLRSALLPASVEPLTADIVKQQSKRARVSHSSSFASSSLYPSSVRRAMQGSAAATTRGLHNLPAKSLAVSTCVVSAAARNAEKGTGVVRRS